MKIDLATLKKIVREEVKKAADSKSPGIDAKTKEVSWENGKRKRTRKRKHTVQEGVLKETADMLNEAHGGRNSQMFALGGDRNAYGPYTSDPRDPRYVGATLYDYKAKVVVCGDRSFLNVVFDMEEDEPHVNIEATNALGALEEDEDANTTPIDAQEVASCFEADPAAKDNIRVEMMDKIRVEEEATAEDRWGV